MELYLLHGRLDPTTGGTDLAGNPVKEWGFEGPRLQGVKGLHQTYDDHPHIFFVSPEAADAAQALTGWKSWDSDALELPITGDCVQIQHGTRQRTAYFGDWGLI